MPVVWTHLSEKTRHNVCALFDDCMGDCKLLLHKFALLGCAPINDIDKLRGCCFVTKEDPSVFLNPIPQLPPFEAQIMATCTMHQTTMDDSPGCLFMPEKVLCPCVVEKEAHLAPTQYLCKICNKSIAPTNSLKTFFTEGRTKLRPIEHLSHGVRCTKVVADLFVGMTNYVCYNHGSDEDGLLSSPYLVD